VNTKYKMKLCNSFHKEGICLYGIRCCFIHGEKNFDQLFSRFKYSSILKINEVTLDDDKDYGVYDYLNCFVNEDELQYQNYQQKKTISKANSLKD